MANDSRYRNTVKSILGNEWYVDIRVADSPSGAPTPYTYKSLPDGFTLSYKGSGEEFTSPLRGSEVTVMMIVDNATTAQFVEDMANDQDQTYVIELLRKDISTGFYHTYWIGYVWPEQIQISYAAYPYVVKIAASDSIARLKNYKGFQFSSWNVWGYFQQIFAAYSPSGTIIQDGNIVPPTESSGAMQKLRWGTTYTSGSSSPGENLWYHIPVSQSLVYPSTAINTTHVRFNVLSDWLANWGCRVYLEGGFYKMVEFRNVNTGSITWVNHDGNGDPDGTTTTENIQINAGATHKIMDGARFFFKEPYSRSRITFVTDTGTPPTESTDLRNFSVLGSNVRNVKEYTFDLGDIWNNQLWWQLNSGSSPVNITGNIGNNTTTGPATLVEIFQDNVEWFYALPQKYFDGTIQSATMNFTNLLVIGIEKYFPNSLTFTASTDEWSGEWVKVGEETELLWLNQNNDAVMINQNNDANFNFQ